MNISFLGGFFPEQFENSILKKSKLQVQNAANIFQWAFIKGLEQNLNHPIKLITALYIGWYPKYYKDIIVRKAYFSNNIAPDNCVMVGFLNFPLIKSIFKYVNLKSAISEALTPDKRNVLIVYSIDPVNLKAAIEAKKRNPAIIVCAIITDCYDYNEDSGLLSKLYLKYITNPILSKLLEKVDCFVVLTDKMVDFLKLHHKPWVRIEGIYNEQSNAQNTTITKNNLTKTALYTGTLEYPYGIKKLLEAFQLIKSENINLWICGGGEGAPLVIKRAQEDQRIKYFGIVSKDKISELQSKATILVNPRNTIGEYNKYSFPSKTIEYLASGTPALLYKLDGIPAEYFEYCYTIEDNEVESLAKAIYKTCQLDSNILYLKGKAAREFILKNKAAKIQCGKVLNMLSNI